MTTIMLMALAFLLGWVVGGIYEINKVLDWLEGEDMSGY